MIQTIAIINLIIAIQSLFLSIHFLLKKNGTQLLNRIMAIITLAFSCVIFNTYYSLSGYVYSKFLQDISNNMMWFIGPSIYLYVNYKTNENSKNLFKTHLYPFFIPFFFDIFFDVNIYEQIIPILALSIMLIYLIASIRLAAINYSTKKTYFGWVMPLIIVFLILILANIIMQLFASFDFIYVPTTIRQSLTTVMIIPIFYLSYKEMNSEKDFGIQKEKYERTQLSDEKRATYLKQINDVLIHDELFKKPQLTLKEVSDIIHISPKYISQVINQNLNLKFTDYLLKLRIEEAKIQLKDPNKNHLSIAGIAENCGFASTSRFNHQFKLIVGMTPSEYKSFN